MKYILSIYLWAVGGLYVGAVMIAIGILTYIFSEHKLDPILKRMLRFMFRIMFIRVKVEGAEQVAGIRPALFMANHVSIFDNLVIEAFTPSYIRGIEADRQFRWFIYGWFIKRLKNIEINRNSIHESIKSIKTAAARLKEGTSIAVMPEGHRTLDGMLLPFKKLPFYLAKDADVPIVPIGLSGLFHLKSKNSWLIRPTTVKIKFGDIIPRSLVREKNTVELMDYTRNQIQSLIERP